MKFRGSLKSFIFILIISTGLSYAASDLLSKNLEKISAHASYDNGKYFCSNPFNADLEQDEYHEFVNNYNGLFQDQTIKPEETAKYILSQSHDKDLDQIGTMAKCLSDNGIEPNSVVSINPSIWDGAQYAAQNSPEKLHEVAPNFASHFFHIVPEFGPVAGMISVISITVVVMMSRKFF